MHSKICCFNLEIRNYEELREVEDDSSAIYKYLTNNNKQIRRTILEHLLNLQKIVIQFENDAKLQGLEREIRQISSSDYSNSENFDFKLLYNELQKEMIKLKAANYSQKIEIK